MATPFRPATELLVRELSEHLQQSFIPKVKELNHSVRSYADPQERSQIADSSVRIKAKQLQDSEAFAETLFTKLKVHLAACDAGADRAAETP